MKKSLVLFAAFVACFALSCNKVSETVKEEASSQAGMKTVTITATIANQTKTTYAPTTGAFGWNAGDQISVLGDDNNFYTFTAASTGATSVFTGSLPGGVELSSYAMFPADAGHAFDGSNLTYNIPEYKDLSSHPSADFPMVGEKGAGDVYAFKHNCGAYLMTVDNIPSGIVSVKITFVSGALKLSGAFGTFKSGDDWGWNADGGSSTSEKTFSRKVAVSSNKAEVYLPYAAGAQMWSDNTVEIIGYDALDNPTTLLSGKTMAGNSAYFVRGEIIPLTPLVLSNLANIDWADAGVSTFNQGTYNYRIKEWKATSDKYYIYFRLQMAAHKVPADPSGDYIYTGFNTNGVAGDGVAPLWSTNLEIEADLEALTLLYPFVSNDGTTVVFKEGEDTAGFIQCPVKTETGKVTTTGYQPAGLSSGEHVYVAFAIPRAKIGSPSGSITVQHVWQGYNSSPGTFTLN